MLRRKPILGLFLFMILFDHILQVCLMHDYLHFVRLNENLSWVVVWNHLNVEYQFIYENDNFWRTKAYQKFAK